ncbi:MAG: branched-chain amino acid transaminase [Candidatus Aureabacteria bacterium]|nr:branched-chain amino acid transaminase [Candidatus Auribacterota bacterium]
MADVKYAEKIFMDGEFIPWDECKIHVMSHVIHYGSSVFEGIRCYKGKDNSYVFRLKDHLKRLVNSAKIYRMELKYTQKDIERIILETIRENQLSDCYIRPIFFRGFGDFGVNPSKSPVHFAVATWNWGTYLGKDAMESGIDVCTSTWRRMAPNTLPSLAKAGGNYLNSGLIKMEADLNGYAEGIALDTNGHISEGSGENIFIVINNSLYTPPSHSSILPGITRHAVIVLARDKGYKVKQQIIPRETIYTADEAFFTGTAAEISVIRSVDRIPIGNGKRGPVTKDLQQDFFAILECKKTDPYGWMTPVY